MAYYDAKAVPFDVLRRIIAAAWDAVPNDYIETLFCSWWKRCQAVIDAEGGPTRY